MEKAMESHRISKAQKSTNHVSAIFAKEKNDAV